MNVGLATGQTAGLHLSHRNRSSESDTLSVCIPDDTLDCVEQDDTVSTLCNTTMKHCTYINQDIVNPNIRNWVRNNAKNIYVSKLDNVK